MYSAGVVRFQGRAPACGGGIISGLIQESPLAPWRFTLHGSSVVGYPVGMKYIAAVVVIGLLLIALLAALALALLPARNPPDRAPAASPADQYLPPRVRPVTDDRPATLAPVDLARAELRRYARAKPSSGGFAACRHQ